MSGFCGTDALHLATARMSGCDVMFTYETEARRVRWQQIVGLPVSEPVTNTPQLEL